MTCIILINLHIWVPMGADGCPLCAVATPTEPIWPGVGRRSKAECALQQASGASTHENNECIQKNQNKKKTTG